MQSWQTQREKAEIPRAKFQAEWVSRPGTDHRRVMLYLPGGAYIMRSPGQAHLLTSM